MMAPDKKQTNKKKAQQQQHQNFFFNIMQLDYKMNMTSFGK